MKSIVIYYTMSGNTKKIAEAIHAGMNESSGGKSDIARLREIETRDLSDYDLIGLGSPVFNSREPSIVAKFIQETMRSVDGKYAFAFSTHGALPGYYFAMVVPAMIQRGLTVIGWDDWFCDVVYPVTPSPYFITGHPDAIDIEEAKAFGKEMVDRSHRISEGEIDLIPTFPRGKAYDDIYVPVEVPPTKEYPEEWDKLLKAIEGVEFKVNTEKCKYPRCTICIDNCPVGSIDFSNSPPKFHANCEKCFHCEQICPNGSIETDYEAFKSAHDLFTDVLLKQSLEFFEAQGRFRRLTPLKDIGWNTPFWKSRKHPRYKIK